MVGDRPPGPRLLLRRHPEREHVGCARLPHATPCLRGELPEDLRHAGPLGGGLPREAEGLGLQHAGTWLSAVPGMPGPRPRTRTWHDAGALPREGCGPLHLQGDHARLFGLPERLPSGLRALLPGLRPEALRAASGESLGRRLVCGQRAGLVGRPRGALPSPLQRPLRDGRPTPRDALRPPGAGRLPRAARRREGGRGAGRAQARVPSPRRRALLLRHRRGHPRGGSEPPAARRALRRAHGRGRSRGLRDCGEALGRPDVQLLSLGGPRPERGPRVPRRRTRLRRLRGTLRPHPQAVPDHRVEFPRLGCGTSVFGRRGPAFRDPVPARAGERALDEDPARTALCRGLELLPLGRSARQRHRPLQPGGHQLRSRERAERTLHAAGRGFHARPARRPRPAQGRPPARARAEVVRGLPARPAGRPGAAREGRVLPHREDLPRGCGRGLRLHRGGRGREDARVHRAGGARGRFLRRDGEPERTGRTPRLDRCLAGRGRVLARAAEGPRRTDAAGARRGHERVLCRGPSPDLRPRVLEIPLRMSPCREHGACRRRP